MKESVFIIIFDSQDRILLQHRDASAVRNPNTWSLWSGTVESDETPVQAASRELKEELDVDIHTDALRFYKTYTSSDRIRHVFYLQDDAANENYHLQEGDDLKRVHISDLKNMNTNDVSSKIVSDFFNLH